MPITNTHASAILTAYYSSLSTRYIGLHTADPTVTGNAATELVGGSYVRLNILFTSPSNRSVQNSNQLVWTNLPASTVTHFAIWTASTGGTIMHTIQAGAGLTVNSGGTIIVPVNDLAFSLA